MKPLGSLTSLAAATLALWVWLVIIVRESNLGRLLLVLAVGTTIAIAVVRLSPVRRHLQAAARAHPGALLAMVASAVVALPFAFASSAYWTVTLTLAALYATVALGLNLQTGTAGLINLSGAAFFGAGAYTSALLSIHTPLPTLLGWVTGGLVALALGALLSWPVTKLRGHYLALVTIAFGVIFHLLLVNTKAVGGPQGIQRIPSLVVGPFDLHEGWTVFGVAVSGRTNYYFAAALLAAFAAWLTHRVRQSPFGVALNAVRDDEYAAGMAGVDGRLSKLIAFSAGSVLLGLAGALYAHMLGSIAPEDFTFAVSLFFVSFIILGGLDSPFGVASAAVLLMVMTEKLRIIEDYRFIIFGSLVILVLLFRPTGLLTPPIRRFGLALPRRS